MTLTEKFVNWCGDPSATARFERTVFQGVLSVIITELPQTLSQLAMPDWISAIIVPCIMAVLSVIQAEIGKNAVDFNGLGGE